MALADYPGWKPLTLYATGQRFQFVGKLYEVLRPFTSEAVFKETSDVTVTSEDSGGGGSDGRGIESVVVNSDGDLIVTYTDSSTENAGHVRSDTSSMFAEKLTVVSDNTLSSPTQTLDTTKLVKLTINHLVYTTMDNSAIIVTNSSISWNPTIGGMDLETSDLVIAEYFIQQV